MIWVVLGAIPLSVVALAAAIWYVLYARHQLDLARTELMAVSAAAQAVVDELNTAVGNLTTALANADAKATAQTAEDIAAIKTAADALVQAISTAAAPPAP